jgi:hypothetical protein
MRTGERWVLKYPNNRIINTPILECDFGVSENRGLMAGSAMRKDAGVDALKTAGRSSKKRKKDRSNVGKGIYVVLFRPGVQNYDRMGQIIDISEYGASFHYVVDRKAVDAVLSEPACRLRIFGAFRMFELEEILVVYDYELQKYSNDPVSVRRCGIRFENLSQQRKSELDRVIALGCYKA